MAALILPAVPGAWAAEPAPADEMAFMKELAGDEKQLVEAVRKYVKEKSSALAPKIKEIRALMARKKTDEAKQKDREFKEALAPLRKAYETVLKQYPQNARAHTYLGELLYDYFFDMQGALSEWNLAISLDNKLSLPRNNLAIHYCENGDYELGIKQYDMALAVDPKNPDILFNLSQAYMTHFPEVCKMRNWEKKKVYAEAMKLSKMAAELAPTDYALAQDYGLNFFGAKAYDAAPDWKGAVKAWQAARKAATRPDQQFTTWMNEGRAWREMGNVEKARPCFEEALKLDPGNANAQNQLQNLAAPEAKAKPRKDRQDRLKTKPLKIRAYTGKDPVAPVEKQEPAKQPNSVGFKKSQE